MKERVLEKAPHVAKILKLLGNESRLKVLCFLSGEEMSVSKIEELTELSQSQVSQILKLLELNGIVSSVKKGKWVYYKISSEEIKQLFVSLYKVFCEEEQENPQ